MNETELLARRQRSPAFPYISLEVALERAGKIYSQVRDHALPRDGMAKAYGKPITSSGTIQTFATLLQYELLESLTTTTGRKLRVSPLAQSILNPHAPEAKVKEGRKIAALKPPIFAELWEKYKDTKGLNDSLVLYYLTKERGEGSEGVFTDSAARDVLRIYRATVDFAEVSEGSRQKSIPASEEGPQVEAENGYASEQVQADKENAENPPSAIELKRPPGNPYQEQPWSPRSPMRTGSLIDWSEEVLLDDGGEEIKILYHGKATIERYEFIRDYLDFKIKRLQAKKA